MKEIIYLDTKLVNSLLAQQNSGLITKLVIKNPYIQACRQRM